ncbi:MAG: ABC transporter ATP-binding protein [Candidatus Binatia bacterium]
MLSRRGRGDVSTLLEIRALDFYYGDAQALAGISLDVPQGEIVAIVGANGAGKTTLIHAIAGIERPRGGRILFAGREITGLDSHQICELGIGLVAEGRQLFPSLTTLENLQMGAMLPRGRGNLKQTLDEVFALFPRLGERGKQLAGTLSGGEQQMLAIGRCLMSRPELIMLDEPSLGLAPNAVRQLLQTVHQLNQKGLTVMLVEQNVAVSLKISQRAYVLENGRIVMSGSGHELLGNDRVRQAYLGL